MANHKSENSWRGLAALSAHLSAYGAVMLLALPWLGLTWTWLAINIVLHGIVDVGTSRVCRALYQQQKIRLFFVVVGLDQLLHYCCLLGTLHEN